MSKKISDLIVTNSLESTDKFLVETEAGTKLAPVAAVRTDVYNGVDLTVVFADEIAEYGNPWSWIKARARARNYAGLHVRDYIPWTLDGFTIESEIAGFEPDFGCTDQALGGHIDFISRDCYPQHVQWNTSDVNQGDATNAAPYMVSNLKAWYDSKVDSLPTELRNAIISKRSRTETRYTGAQTLQSSTSWVWNDLGKLWAPHESEVFDRSVWSGRYANGNGTKYPAFADGRARLKQFGKGGDRCSWWECDAMDASATYVCLVNYTGCAYYSYASLPNIAPVLGFRIG